MNVIVSVDSVKFCPYCGRKFDYILIYNRETDRTGEIECKSCGSRFVRE
jgi:uncharacterized Zn-finger protein